MKVTTTSDTPFEKVVMDIVGPLTQSYERNKYILTIQDDLTKFIIACPLLNQEAETVAQMFVEHFICKYGTPKSIQTDQGSNFMSNLFKNVCTLLKINKINSTAYHPQSQGGLERTHRTLGEYFRNFCAADPQNWDHWLCYATFSYNSTPHESTSFMPFELLYGFKPTLPSSLQREPQPIYNFNNYCEDLKNRLRMSWKIAKENLIVKKIQSKENYDKTVNIPAFKPHDQVNLESVNKSKFEPLRNGPYEIVSIDSPENSTIKINGKNNKVHNNRLKLFHE